MTVLVCRCTTNSPVLFGLGWLFAVVHVPHKECAVIGPSSYVLPTGTGEREGRPSMGLPVYPVCVSVGIPGVCVCRYTWCVCLSVYLACVCLSVYLVCVCLSVYLVCVSVCIPGVCVCLSVYPACVCLSVYLVCVDVCLYTWCVCVLCTESSALPCPPEGCSGPV